jgi:hypothetical protein
VVTHLVADGRWYSWADVEPASPVRNGPLLNRHVLDSQIVDLTSTSTSNAILLLPLLVLVFGLSATGS